MYQVIARKYRPQTFAELVGQEHVRTTLENAITQRRIAQWLHLQRPARYRQNHRRAHHGAVPQLRKGPDGDSPAASAPVARKSLGGGAMDVIEIDAASNRGINEMRELRENVRFRPRAIATKSSSSTKRTRSPMKPSTRC